MHAHSMGDYVPLNQPFSTLLLENSNHFSTTLDINECDLGLCDNNSICFNTPGTFSCICDGDAGFVMTEFNNTVMCVGEERIRAA